MNQLISQLQNLRSVKVQEENPFLPFLAYILIDLSVLHSFVILVKQNIQS